MREQAVGFDYGAQGLAIPDPTSSPSATRAQTNTGCVTGARGRCSFRLRTPSAARRLPWNEADLALLVVAADAQHHARARANVLEQRRVQAVAAIDGDDLVSRPEPRLRGGRRCRHVDHVRIGGDPRPA